MALLAGRFARALGPQLSCVNSAPAIAANVFQRGMAASAEGDSITIEVRCNKYRKWFGLNHSSLMLVIVPKSMLGF